MAPFWSATAISILSTMLLYLCNNKLRAESKDKAYRSKIGNVLTPCQIINVKSSSMTKSTANKRETTNVVV